MAGKAGTVILVIVSDGDQFAILQHKALIIPKYA